MNPRSLLLDTAARFRAAGIPDPETDSALLLSFLTGQAPLSLRLDSDTELSAEILESFSEMAERRLAREPLQYITGEAPFFGRVYRAEFGIQTGLRFEDKIAQRQVKRARKDYYEVDLVVKRHMEHLFYSFDIYDNGKVTLMVRSDNRDTMHFSGDLVIE